MIAAAREDSNEDLEIQATKIIMIMIMIIIIITIIIIIIIIIIIMKNGTITNRKG